MDLLARWKTIQLLGVDPETRAGLGELRFSVIDHGTDVTLYVDIPPNPRGAVAAPVVAPVVARDEDWERALDGLGQVQTNAARRMILDHLRKLHEAEVASLRCGRGAVDLERRYTIEVCNDCGGLVGWENVEAEPPPHRGAV